ncbi:MAG: DUF5020 family protein [Mangrovibacterium sp.]
MKKIFLFVALATISASAFAQNIQTHYDFGDTRKCVTTTVEMFRPDKIGSTFFFIDMNYNEGEMHGVTNAYWEISRAFTFKQGSSLAAHVEYDGGFFRTDGALGLPINSAFLGGLENTWGWDNFNKTFTLQALFKTIQGKNDASFQLTAVWNTLWFDGKLSFNGFMDFWKEDNVAMTGEATEYVWLTEPQLWYNFQNGMKGFSLGTEIEMSANFSGNKGFMCNPTIAMKYSF